MLPALADEHVKSAIVTGLLRRGLDIVTAQQRGLQAREDQDILAATTREGRIVLTNDADYLVIHSQWIAAGRDHAGIVYWPQLKYSIGQVIRRILDYANKAPPTDAANQVHFL